MKVPALIYALLVPALVFWPVREIHSTNAPSDDQFSQLISAGEFIVQGKLRQSLAQEKASGLSDAIFRENLTLAKQVYSSTEYKPLWWTENGPTSQALMLLELFRDSASEGLSEADYDIRNLEERVARIQAHRADATETAVWDLGMTVSAFRYMSDLHRGRVDPRRASWNVEPQPVDFDQAEFLLRRVVLASSVGAVIAEMEPTFPGYQRTRAALQHYLALAKEGEGPAIPVSRRPILPGESYSGVQPLAKRLFRTRDLASATYEGPGDRYAGSLVEAVKSFQTRHGLPATGTLDGTTVSEINVPFAERATQLQLALERWRWLPAGLKPPMIVVNIPEFQLRAYEDHRLAFMMPVVVGKAFKGRETPIFMDELEHVIFRPYWYVPVDITRKELLVRLARDPDYLQKNQFTIVDRKDNIVAIDRLDEDVIKQLRSGSLQLRQMPGPANSLGLIKFVFPNDYAVYLHGTPEMRLFERARRDFSHGCIRVQDPVTLAGWVLRDDPTWTRERIESAMRSEEPERAKLRTHLPVLVLYGTAMVEENGEVRFYRDIYGLDRSLIKLLAERPK